MRKRYQEYKLLDVTNTKWARTFFTRPNGEISLHMFFTTLQPNTTVGHIGSPKQPQKNNYGTQMDVRQYKKKNQFQK